MRPKQRSWKNTARAWCATPPAAASCRSPPPSKAWILARDKQLEPAQRAAIVARAQALGVDTNALIWVAHTRTDPTH